MLPGAATEYNRKVLVVFDSKGGTQQAVPFTVTTVLEGLSAERLRNTLAKDSPEEMQKQLIRLLCTFLSQPYRGTSL